MPTNTQSTAQPEALLAWNAPILPRHNRSPRWYMILAVIILGVAAYGILTSAWTLSVVAVLIGCMEFLLRGAEPPIKHISLTTNGIFLDGGFTRWEDCSSFWIIRTPQYTRLHIGKRDPKARELHIQIENVDPQEVRWTLSQFLSEDTQQVEKIVDIIIRICKL